MRTFRTPPSLPAALALLLWAAGAQAAGGEREADGASLRPASVGRVRARALAREPEARLVVEVRRAPLEGAAGERISFLVKNDGAQPARLFRVELSEPAPLRTTAPLSELRALAVDADGRARVMPFRVEVRAAAAVGLALVDGREAMIAAVPRIAGGVRAALSLVPDPEAGPDRAALSVAFTTSEAPTLEPGDERRFSDLIVVFAPGARSALQTLFPPAADVGEGGAGADPFALLGVVRGDGVGRLALASGRVPLDLFASDGVPRALRLPDGTLLLRNPDAVRRIVVFATRELGVRPGEALRLLSPEGAPLGRYLRRVAVPMPPHASLRLGARAEPAQETGGWRLLAVRPPFAGAPGEVYALVVDAPDFAARLDEVLLAGGLVLADLRGGDPDDPVLEPLPAALARRLAAHVHVVRPRRAERPEGEAAAYTERASNIEWRFGLERGAAPPTRLLVSLEAGFHATPLDPWVADGAPAARGFFVPAPPAAALLFLDLPDERLDDIAHRLLALEERRALYREVSRARRTVREAARSSGLFGRVPLPRLGPDDLAPGDPYSRSRFSVQVFRSEATVERRRTANGAVVADDVLPFARPLSFAADLPLRPGERLVGILRRAPSRSLEGFRVEIGNRVVFESREGGDPSQDGWIEEMFPVPREAIGPFPRQLVVVLPEGGVLPLARIGFRVRRPLLGTPLDALPDGAVSLSDSSAFVDRSATGGYLEVGGVVYPFGYGLAPGGHLEAELDGTFGTLLGRVALDDRVRTGARAIVVALVDGREVLRLELAPDGETALPLTVDVFGGRRVRVECLPPPDSAAGASVDLLDLRLVER